jgi:hypothetical protein
VGEAGRVAAAVAVGLVGRGHCDAQPPMLRSVTSGAMVVVAPLVR